MSKPSAIQLSPRTRRTLLFCVTQIVMLTSTAASATVPIEHYSGTAYDTKGHTLYTESHWSTVDAGQTKRLILFTCPDGKAFARKQVDDADNAEAPLFQLDDHRSGYREGMRLNAAGKYEVFVRRNSEQPEQSAAVESRQGLVVDAGFDRFIVTHWDDLLAGQEQKVEFMLPSRLRSYGFLLKPTGTDQINGTPVQRFRLEIDSWLGFALPSIDIAYASDSKAIREYSGVSNIRDNEGKNVKVRIEFPPAARLKNADLKSLTDAQSVRLDGQCKL